MKKFLSLISLLNILINLSLADDLLVKLTKGKLSDYSNGVKVLSFDEMKEVKGGYVVGFKALSNDEILAYAIPNWENELGLYTEDGVKYYYNRQGLLLNGGMCGLGITKCRLSDKENNQKHYYENRKRLIEVMSILGGNTDPYTHYLGYSVKRNIGTTSRGERFIYFSYGVAVINNSGNWYRVHSSNVLNHYKLIKEIRDAYRADMESILNRFR